MSLRKGHHNMWRAHFLQTQEVACNLKYSLSNFKALSMLGAHERWLLCYVNLEWPSGYERRNLNIGTSWQHVSAESGISPALPLPLIHIFFMLYARKSQFPFFAHCKLWAAIVTLSGRQIRQKLRGRWLQPWRRPLVKTAPRIFLQRVRWAQGAPIDTDKLSTCICHWDLVAFSS